VNDREQGQKASGLVFGRTGPRPMGPPRALGDAWRFVRDVVWLLGWGFSRIASAVGTASRSREGRGSISCLASVGAVLTGLMFWRRRKGARRIIRRVSPTRLHSDSSVRPGKP
jgi:hypothetical protein